MWQIILSFFIFLSFTLNAQNSTVNWEERSSLLEPVSNNAITSANINGEVNIFSFAGIDSTINHSGIHLKGFRYSVIEDKWYNIAPLPDTLGKVAAGASTVKNKIYILGGYHVYDNGNEKSSNRVHIYDPETDQYLADGAPIPIPIDDHVQAVWRDSLIYVITGWSDDKNVPNVQIYDPSLNSWKVGSPVPNTLPSVVFGGSGTIIGDTIYYAGGARFAQNFPLTNVIRIGVIDPNQPENITWTASSDNLALGYRMGAFSYKHEAYWTGGSVISYNYDGIAYNGSGAVPPVNRVLRYDDLTGNLVQLTDTIFPIMDLRGIAQISENQFMIVGGMLKGPIVSNKTFLFTLDQMNSNSLETELSSLIILKQEEGQLILTQELQKKLQYAIIDLNGKELKKGTFRTNTQNVDISSLSSGIYFIKIMNRKKIEIVKFLVN